MTAANVINGHRRRTTSTNAVTITKARPRCPAGAPMDDHGSGPVCGHGPEPPGRCAPLRIAVTGTPTRVNARRASARSPTSDLVTLMPTPISPLQPA
ncbi:hypothetical protein [Fodinicola feengrottensis]|uniref:hypothetical protein n=1 Tax=Fodinicola feengrottensis TaxID=435914 RepID=UPI0036F30A16